jgi:hypothetical protein
MAGCPTLETSTAWELSAQFEVVEAAGIGVPVARAVVVSMKGDLLVSSERERVAVFGRPLDGLPAKSNDYLLFAPADPLYPFRRDQDLLAR